MTFETLRDATSYVTALSRSGTAASCPLDAEQLTAFKDACGIQGLGPYLGWRLEHGELDVPETIGCWVREQLARNRARLQRMRSELILLIETCDNVGISTIPLKGAAMLLDCPDAIGWRTMADLDLLIPGSSPHDVDRALAGVGYRLADASWKHRRYTARPLGLSLVVGDGEHPDNPRDVEVHDAVVEMFRGFRWDLTGAINDRVENREGVARPNPDAMALHLTVHCSMSLLEGSGRAIQLIDLARALDLAGPSSVVDDVRTAGIREHARFAYPALAFVARELGHHRASAAMRELQPFVPEAMVEWTRAASLYDVSWAGRNSRRLFQRHALWALGPRERVRLLQHTLAPTRAMLANQGHDTTTLRDAFQSYRAHYRHLVRRIRSAG
ncbi:MAG: nucleotidyltransferase family protein [Chloroflexota bacterium]|nr:nucleotidyltransferase family protein [Chloroflexota bacterium]